MNIAGKWCKTLVRPFVTSLIVMRVFDLMQCCFIIHSSYLLFWTRLSLGARVNSNSSWSRFRFILFHAFIRYLSKYSKLKQEQNIVEQRNITQYRKRKIKFTMDAIGKLRSDRLRVFESSNHPCFKKIKR